MPAIAYTGRFAPSPTGPLHFGSLITALASWCDARKASGRWLVRIEDTDLLRNQMDAESQILQALQRYGFTSDAPILRQQDRLSLYNQIIDHLAAHDLVYGCACSRKQLEGMTAYPGFCRDKHLPLTGNAVRLRVPNREICIRDRLQGEVCENLSQTTGDVVLRRRDGIISYQLAVVVDDLLQGVTHVVRGADLLDNTIRQVWLREVLMTLDLALFAGITHTPVQYCHMPLAMNEHGQKLSKQNLAVPLDLNQPLPTLNQAWAALGQVQLPQVASPQDFLTMAAQLWNLDRVTHSHQLAGIYR